MKPRRSKNNLENGSLFDRFEQSINYLRECPVCKAQYGKDQIDSLYEQQNVHLVHVTCPTCQNMLVAVLAASAMGISSVGMLTDLSADDIVRTQEISPVSEDDVLDFHTLISKQPQRFVHLFKA